MQSKSNVESLTTGNLQPPHAQVAPTSQVKNETPESNVKEGGSSSQAFNQQVPSRAMAERLSQRGAWYLLAAVALVPFVTYFLASGGARGTTNLAVVFSLLATVVSVTCGIWIWWKEFVWAAVAMTRAVVTPWLCFIVGLLAVSASHIWLAATKPEAFVAINPIATVPVLILAGHLFRELLKRTSNGIVTPRWEQTIEPDRAEKTSEAPKRVVAGDIVIADSRISKGSVVVLERWLTPVAELKIRDEQEVIFAGSKVVVGDAEVVPLSRPAESVLTQLVKSIRKIHQAQPNGILQSVVSNTVCFICLCCAAAVGIFWNERGVSAVTSANLAATVLSASIFLLVWQSVQEMAIAATQSLWRTGVFVRSRQVLDRLRKTRHLAVVQSQSRKHDRSPSAMPPLGVPRVVGFDVLDDRYDKEALAGVLLALSGRAEDVWHQAICRYINRSGLPISLLRAADYREYDGRGVCAVIQGVDFTLGSEGFVLDRGVQLQSGDTCPPDAVYDQVIYLAIQRYVVLRLSLKWDTISNVDVLRRFEGDRISLINLSDDTFATEKITDHITLMKGETEVVEASLLSDSPDLILDGVHHPAMYTSRTVTVERFRGSSFELPMADVVLFTPELHVLGDARETADYLTKWESKLRGLVIGLSGASLFAALLGFGAPVVTVALACGVCSMSIRMQKMLRLS